MHNSNWVRANKQTPCPVCGRDHYCSVTSDGAVCVCTKIESRREAKNGAGWIHVLKQRDPDVLEDQVPMDLIQELCRNKAMPLNYFLQLGAVVSQLVTKRGTTREVVAVPVYDYDKSRTGEFLLWPNAKGMFRAGTKHGVFVAHADDGTPRWPLPGEQVLLCEGCKDQAALMSLGFQVIGLPTSFLNFRFAELFEGCDAVIVPDLDEAAMEGVYRTGGSLAGIARSVKVARLPGELRSSKGIDVRDVLALADGPELVRRSVTIAEIWVPRHGRSQIQHGKPRILIDELDDARLVDDTLEALGKLGWFTPWIPIARRESIKLYVHHRKIVKISTDEDSGLPFIEELQKEVLPEYLLQAATFYALKEKGEELLEVDQRPPSSLVLNLSKRREFNQKLRKLVGVITTPTIRNDGTILQEPGWDLETGLYLKPYEKFPRIDELPTRDDALHAVKRLNEIILDFPMGPADRSAWLAMLLTLVGREAVAGCVPAFAVGSHTPGSGKGLATDVACLIAYGREQTISPYPSDAEEQRKSIGTIAREGRNVVLWDNANFRIEGSAIEAALTAKRWSDRKLGASESLGEIELRTVWIFTGNNITFGGDMPRRVLPIEINSPMERPEERKDFRHPNLKRWVSENRQNFVVDALTILRAFFVAGCPQSQGGDWGSFESWSQIIRGAIVWCGLADPLEKRSIVRADDCDIASIRCMLSGLREVDPDNRGITSLKIIERVQNAHSDQEFEVMREVLATYGTANHGRYCSTKLGRLLGKFAGRIVVTDEGDSVSIRKSPHRTGVVSWSIEKFNDETVGCANSFESLHEKHDETLEKTNSAGVAGVTSLPIEMLTDSKSSQQLKTPGAEASVPAYPSEASNCESRTIQCPMCSSVLVPYPLAVKGWRNYDCPNCHKVVPVNEVD